ncbi:hypothetical protein AVEN_221538-1, partial [Araneus ventricosus]
HAASLKRQSELASAKASVTCLAPEGWADPRQAALCSAANNAGAFDPKLRQISVSRHLSCAD